MQWLKTADERRDPLRLPDDRTRGGLVGRHQYRDLDQARRRSITSSTAGKWWSSGVGDPRCKIAIVMGKTDPKPACVTSSEVADPGAARTRKGIKVENYAVRCSATTMRRTSATPRWLLDNVRVLRQ